jgi:hypothetical protein
MIAPVGPTVFPSLPLPIRPLILRPDSRLRERHIRHHLPIQSTCR